MEAHRNKASWTLELKRINSSSRCDFDWPKGHIHVRTKPTIRSLVEQIYFSCYFRKLSTRKPGFRLYLTWQEPLPIKYETVKLFLIVRSQLELLEMLFEIIESTKVDHSANIWANLLAKPGRNMYNVISMVHTPVKRQFAVWKYQNYWEKSFLNFMRIRVH